VNTRAPIAPTEWEWELQIPFAAGVGDVNAGVGQDHIVSQDQFVEADGEP
jgi:hypothetical protein